MNNSTGLPPRPRILLIRLSAIGDVLHATSVAHNLKLFLPDARLFWLCSPPADDLLRGNPDVNEILSWDRREFDKAVAGHKFGKAFNSLRAARRLLREHGPFDVVLDIQGLLLTGILSLLTGYQHRIGIHERHEGNPFFMTEMAPDIADPHKIRRYLTALMPLGWQQEDFVPGTVLALAPDWESYAQNFWQSHGIVPQKPILMVNLRTTWPDKHLTPKAFGQLLEHTDIPEGFQLVFPGAPGDKPCIEETISYLKEKAPDKASGAICIAGETSLRELAALIKSANLLLTCDTGPLYLAEAVGTPTFSLWGPTLPTIYGPLSPGHHFYISPHECTACCKTNCPKGNACMEAMPLHEVARKLSAILDKL